MAISTPISSPPSLAKPYLPEPLSVLEFELSAQVALSKPNFHQNHQNIPLARVFVDFMPVAAELFTRFDYTVAPIRHRLLFRKAQERTWYQARAWCSRVNEMV